MRNCIKASLPRAERIPEKQEDKRLRNVNFSYGMRSIAGLYMLYLAYQLVEGHISGEASGIQFLIFGILFGVIGLACVLSGARFFLTGKMDKRDCRGGQDLADQDSQREETDEDVEEDEEK